METIGLQAILDDKDFQEGLARYSAGVVKMEKVTDQALKAINVQWNEAAQRFQTASGKFISTEAVEASLNRLKTQLASVNEGTDRVANGVAANSSKFRSFGETLDRSGRQAMIGMRSLGEVANLAGLNVGLSQSVGMIANVSDAVGDLSGAFAALSPTLLALTAVAAGLAIVFSRVQEESKKAAEEAARIKEPFEQARKEIQALIELKGIDRVAKELGTTSEALKVYPLTFRTTPVPEYVFPAA